MGLIWDLYGTYMGHKNRARVSSALGLHERKEKRS
jgi:hypothetical protein